MALSDISSDPVLIIGGGIIGLSIGWQLARQERSVIILEKELAGRQASWVAAGMLAPFSEAGFEELTLGEMAFSFYPRFLEELEEDSGEQVVLEGKGTLFVALNQSDRKWLEWIYAFKESRGLPLQWLEEDELRAKEPLLSPRVVGGIWLPTERQIHHRRLIEALKRAFLSRGGILRERVEVAEILQEKECFRGVRLKTGEEIGSPIGVLAAGAWSSRFCKEIRPVKGQIVSAHSNRYQLSHMIRTPRVYLAQKNDGTMRVGATSEEKGFDGTPYCGAALQILQSAFEIFPAIEEFAFDGLEASFRPMSKTDLPIIQKSAIEGFHLAIGHGRGGILFAPYTAYKTVRGIYGNQSEWSSNDSSPAANFG